MISIVIVGRNDNYGGDFEQRLLATCKYNSQQLSQHGVSHEVVLVEWNPLDDKPLLSENVVAEVPHSRCVVVDPSVHRYICRNKHIAVYEYYAKNVGASRAQGSWLMIMNPDNYLGNDIVRFLAEGSFNEETLYRAGWINIHSAEEVDDTSLVDAHIKDLAPFGQASGDFIFCHRDLFARVGGFREDLPFTNTHKDSIFVTAAYELTGRAEKIGHTYHLDHSRDSHGERRLGYEWSLANRDPQSQFGLHNLCVEETVSSRITALKLKPELTKRVQECELPSPEIPRHLRTRRHWWSKIRKAAGFTC